MEHGWEIPMTPPGMQLPLDLKELSTANHGHLFTRPQMDDMDHHVGRVREVLSTQNLLLYLYTRNGCA